MAKRVCTRSHRTLYKCTQLSAYIPRGACSTYPDTALNTHASDTLADKCMNRASSNCDECDTNPNSTNTLILMIQPHIQAPLA